LRVEFGTGFLSPETDAPKTNLRRYLRAETGTWRPPHARNGRKNGLQLDTPDEQKVAGLTAISQRPHSEWFRKAVVDVRRDCPNIEAGIEIIFTLAGFQAEMRICADKIKLEYFAGQSDADEIKRLLFDEIKCSDADAERML
jgi:hypothetical protein